MDIGVIVTRMRAPTTVGRLLLVALLGCGGPPAPANDGTFAPLATAEPVVLDSLVPLPVGADTLTHRVAIRADSLPLNGMPGDARSRIVFADSATLDIPVRDAMLLFALPAAQGADWLLVSGTECSECDAPEVVWIFRGVPGVVTERGLAADFPGELTTAGVDDETPFSRSRLFLGTCLDDGEPAAIWLEETLQPDTARSRIARILRGAPRLHVGTFAWTDSFEVVIHSHVGAGSCREVPPLDQAIF